MEDYIKISTLNDFIFCPKSIYYHNLYDSFDSKIYHDKAQIEWKIAHEKIDKGVYSKSKHILQWTDVYSENFKLCWKIDIFNIKKWELIERKNLIFRDKNWKEKIYIWYKYQIWAQMFCLEEMWYEVRNLYFYSLKDNRKYKVSKPSSLQFLKFEKLLEDYKNYDLDQKNWKQNSKKCFNCIYRELCDFFIWENYTQLNLFDKK